MEANIKKSCPNCSQLYNLKNLSKPKGNVPLYLLCGHSMCESCISNIVKFEEPLECKICFRDTKVSAADLALLSHNKMKLYQLFPVNLTMLGELTYQLMEQIPPQTKEEDYYVDIQGIIKSTDSTQGLCLECHNPTSKMCKQCATILCDNCFNKSHNNFIMFQNHVLQNIEQVEKPNNCKTHSGKPLEYYCKDCTKSICMDCLMVGGDKSCKNHNVVSMQEVNDGFLEEINDIAPKVDETFRRLTKSAVDVGHLLHNIVNETGTSSELTHMLANIEQHFSKLTSIIQKHKQEVLDTVVKLKNSERESLRKVKTDLANNIKKAIHVLNSINSTLGPKTSKQTNLAVLLDEAKQVIESPWYLGKDESDDPLKVAVNEDLCTLISDYIHLEGNAHSVYKLRQVSELGDGTEIPPPPIAPVFPPELPKDVRQINQSKVEKKYPKEQAPAPPFYRNVPKYRSKSGSVSSLNSLESDSSMKSSGTIYGEMFHKPVVQPVLPFAESQHPKQLIEDVVKATEKNRFNGGLTLMNVSATEWSQELIYITHIVDPHNFYVQRSCHQSLVKEMLREFRNAVSLHQPSLNHVSEGKIYLMFNKTDNMWQRCRVVSINRKNINNPVFLVFCIDFGSTEEVSIEKLRLIPPARLQSPYPLAINCCLANCEPKTGSWTSDDSYLIQNIIDNKQALIHIRHIRSTSNYSVKIECDVTTFDDGISISHALVFHERARMPNPKLPYPRIVSATEKPKLYINNDFKPKAIEEVYITQIVSPDKFFVRKRHVQNVYEKLCEDLEQTYSLSVNNGSVYLPEVGMVCVVNVESHRESAGASVGMGAGEGRWARAVVHELPGRGRVRVLLPDTGALLLAHWTRLRHILHRFTTLRALATECHLAGVTPLNKKWSPGSVALLQRFEERLLELHVEDSRRGSIGVTLYDKADEDNVVCVNTEMIKYKFAVTFGLFMFNKNAIVEDQVITNKSPLDEAKPKPKQKSNKITVLQKNQTPKKINDTELEAKDKGPLRLEAKVLHYQSPSLLYVSLVHQQKTFNELFDKIQKHYSKKKTNGRDKWTVGDRCCTVCNQSQTWRRALIIDLEGENAKIFYSDFACVETVPISSLRELYPDFASIGDAAIKCHLCGVVPAVGEEWPTITKEYLKELLDAYQRVFITKLGNFKNKSMPVELWVYHTIQGGALEPNTSEWRCLNKKIIEQGLGVPDKTQQVPEAGTSTDQEDDMLKFLNITGSVQEWLQLEPLPTKPLNLNFKKETTKSKTPSPVEESEDDGAEAEAAPDPSHTVFISDWLPSEPLPCNEFTAMPTYIDNNGVIYLHTVTQQDTLELIRKALDVRFKNPDPKAKYAKWTVGEPCIALFFLDNRFYRGRVLEVNEETSSCIIHYIDYGNEEACSFENLRKSIALYQIPIQAHKCVLSRIRPIDGTWDRQVLDYIHKSIVEKQCFVKVTGEHVGGVIPIDLKYDKLWINDHLVDFEMAKYVDGSKAVVRKFAPTNKKTKHVEPLVIESDSGPDYIVDEENETESSSRDTSVDNKFFLAKDWNKMIEEDEQSCLDGKFITYPKNDRNEFMCNITIINDINVLELSIIHDDETNLLYEQMFEELQKLGENMPPLNGIFENKACIALFHEDGQWYRASILQYSESDNRIKVRYVDYGNVEVVTLADVREINEEYATLPPATMAVRLHGVQVNPDHDIKYISEKYSETFLDKGPFNAKVIDHDESLPSVDLRDDDGELVYESLILDGVFVLCEP